MTEDQTTTEPTATQKTEPEPTTAQPEPEKTFTQAELEQHIKDRLDRERKKYSDYADLKKAKDRLEEIEREKLTEDERAAQKLKDLEDKIAEKEAELAERSLRDLKRSKIEQAIADGKLTLPKGKTIDSLVRRMIGTTDEELDSDIDDLAGFFPPSKSVATGTQTGPQPKPATKSVEDQLAEISVQLAKTNDPQERDRLVSQSLMLKLRAAGHIKGES